MASFDHRSQAEKITSDSKAKIDTSSLTEEARNNYQRVSQAILENGWQNETFPKGILFPNYCIVLLCLI
jgi:hypothetical protein